MKGHISDLISAASGMNKEEALALLETPPSSDMGDYAFPCFALSKTLKKSPVEIAKELSVKIVSEELEKVEAKGPYLNFFIDKKSIASKTINQILKEKKKYGSKKQKGSIMIEFSQPNTHKAFHVGHIRGTSLGESLSRIFEFEGKKVIRANYSGDTGMHIAKWIWCYRKFHHKEPLKNDESWIASIYVDAIKRLAENPDLQSEVDEINKKIESKSDKSINDLWKSTRKLSIDSWKRIYLELNTHFDVHFFESEIEIDAKKTSESLLKEGIALKSDEAVIMDLKGYNLGVWVLLRKDGTVLYSAKDLVLAKKKVIKHPADRYLVVVGDEQKLHFEQLVKTLELMKFEKKDQYLFLTFGMVRLPTGKMSSRTGDNILYSEFMEEITDYAKEEIQKREKLPEKELNKRALAISIAAIKYSMLKQNPNNVIVFNKEEALRFEGDTGPYLLYTYARARSILNKARYKQNKTAVPRQVSDSEKSLILLLSQLEEIVCKSGQDFAPNLIANYAFDLAQKFNEYYHSEQVIGSENESFRLALVDAFSIVLKNALGLLGIDSIERM